MANQVASMQTTRSYGFDPNMHSGFLPGGVHPGFWLEELCKVLVFNQIWPHKTILVTLVEVLLCKPVHSYHCHRLNVSNF